MSPVPARAWIASLIGPIAFAMISGVVHASVTFGDTTFDNSDYTQSIFESPAGIVFGVGQTASGNPGTAMEGQYSTTDPFFSVLLGFFRADFSYDASTSGPVTGIDVTLDRYFLPKIDGVDTGVGAFTLRTFIVQGANIYQSIQTFPGLPPGQSDQWVTLAAANLGETDFLSFDFTTNTIGSANPDFDQPFSFGFGMRATGAGGIGTNTGTLRADNWFVTVNAVPEPATLALLSLGLAGLGFSRRKH